VSATIITQGGGGGKSEHGESMGHQMALKSLAEAKKETLPDII